MYSGQIKHSMVYLTTGVYKIFHMKFPKKWPVAFQWPVFLGGTPPGRCTAGIDLPDSHPVASIFFRRKSKSSTVPASKMQSGLLDSVSRSIWQGVSTTKGLQGPLEYCIRLYRALEKGT